MKINQIAVAVCGVVLMAFANFAIAKPKNQPKTTPKPSVVGEWRCKVDQDGINSRVFVIYRPDGSYFIDEVASMDWLGKTHIYRYRALGDWQIKDNQYRGQEKEFEVQASDGYWEAFPEEVNREKFDEVSQIIRLDAHHFDYSTDGYLVQCRRV